MGGRGLFLSNSVCGWDYRKMIVNEGGGGGEGFKEFYRALGQGSGKI